MIKKRLLLVEDEPLVLRGLQRMLRPMLQEWDMEFAESGALALQRADEAPFDVVVSDMRMPGMNGAELLTEMMKRHPKTVRIILSGYADKELSLKCVGAAHQFLSKPLDPESLQATIKRASGIGNSIEDGRLKQLVARMNRLPSLPSLYVEIVDKLNEPEATIEDVGNIISKDVGMTAQILKLVNSAFFGLSRPVTNSTEAAFFLGLDVIKSLVLSIHAFSQFDNFKSGGLNLEALMQHSLSTGARAKQIAQLEEASRKFADECFVAGMLHDTGKLVLAANYPDDYQRAMQLVRSGNVSGCAAETEVFGADHASVGGYLLGLWGLPASVVEAIALHHLPDRSGQSEFSALTAVHVANALEREHASGSDGLSDAKLDTDYLTALGLEHRVGAWRESQPTT